jgi:hypothetical protein
MPGHLLSLRQAVLEQEANSEVLGENIISEDTINQNFDSIITQIANSNVDIFFDKNNQFKNCK